jgi:hypothetical protein
MCNHSYTLNKSLQILKNLLFRIFLIRYLDYCIANRSWLSYACIFKIFTYGWFNHSFLNNLISLSCRVLGYLKCGLTEHFTPYKMEVVFAVTRSRESMANQNLCDFRLLSLSESWWFMRWLRQIKFKLALVFNFAKNLNKFLESSGYVISIRKLLELPSYLLGFEEWQRRVLPHLLVVSITISMSTND